MDSQINVLVEELIKTAQNPPTDWWMFGATLASVVAFVVLTVMMWRTNKRQSELLHETTERLGKQQIELQKNAQKISLFEKYAAIYAAYIEDITSFKTYEHAILADTKIFDPDREITKKISGVLSTVNLLLSEKECITLGLISNHISEIKLMIQFISKQAKEKNVYFDIDFNKYTGVYNNINTMRNYDSEIFYAQLRKYSIVNEKAIDVLKFNQNAINKLIEESNIQKALENYCNINNILK